MSKQHDYKYRALIEGLTDDPDLLEAARGIDRKCLTEQGASHKEAAEIVAGSRTPEPSRVSSGELVRRQDVESAMCEDIKARQRKGLSKYGVSVANAPLSQREWLTHAYEEALDLAVYLKKIIDGTQPPNDQAQRSAPATKSKENMP